jgi:hypothetical protein
LIGDFLLFAAQISNSSQYYTYSDLNSFYYLNTIKKGETMAHSKSNTAVFQLTIQVNARMRTSEKQRGVTVQITFEPMSVELGGTAGASKTKVAKEKAGATKSTRIQDIACSEIITALLKHIDKLTLAIKTNCNFHAV